MAGHVPLLMMMAIWMLALVLIGLGVAGLVLPGLPGAPLIFIGLLTAAWAEDFAYVGWKMLLVLGVMAVLTYVVDLGAAALGADLFGGTRRGLIGGAIGAFVGLFFGIPGVVFGPFLGAVIGELTGRAHLRRAGMAGFGAVLGFLVGTAAKLALAVSMIGVFLFVRFG